MVCNRKEARPISHTDRKLLAVENVGSNCAKDMVWGKFSVLQKYADATGVLHEAYTAALREVANQADFHDLDDVGKTLVSVGKEYGVGFDAQIKNRMIIQNGSFSSSVGLFDGNTPLNQRGTGSQRLLSMGLNIQASAGNVLLLIDEIESGLEPYRLRSLLNQFRNMYITAGQVIITTHSPIAVAECTIAEILIVQSKAGKTEVFQLKGDDPDANAIIQAQIRKNAEAFLCKRLIVCEGKTEMGFVRALDSHLAKTKNYRMAFKGVGTADGGGSTIFKCTDILRSCGYEVCLLMDSDLPDEDGQKADLLLDDVSVFDWDKPNALEEQIFFDIPTDIATKILNIAVSECGIDSVKTRLTNEHIPHISVDDEIQLSTMTPEVQKKIGIIAKKKGVEWYKRIDYGEMVGNIIFEKWEVIRTDSKLKKVVDELMKWVIGNDRS
ncbi:MAG: AAA family ATPase [Oscillospiraceae bacterium]|nr:AAA family ATPase [Oscillospiraceae bacterium]